MNPELNLLFRPARPKSQILQDVRSLIALHSSGRLGGEQMPEDVHPKISNSSAELAHYFTLCMALNYQRDSYALWRAATKTFEDPATAQVFDPRYASAARTEILREQLTRHRVALQPVRHTQNWQTISRAICDLLGGDIRNLFIQHQCRAGHILEFVQITHKNAFPYLGGPKICNYWLYVMDGYTSWKLQDRDLLSVAPDTHVIKASLQLGLLGNDSRPGDDHSLRLAIAQRWRELLDGSGIAPIDIHTPLWLWSRANFLPLR